jgi:hypothetical protein
MVDPTTLVMNDGMSDYSTEPIMEQCLTCEHVKLREVQDSGVTYLVTCGAFHTPYLNYTAKGEGDTLIVTEKHCKYRVRIRDKK